MMKPWTDKNGTTKMLVRATESIEAQKALDKKIADIKQVLGLMETELQKYESLRYPDWSHVGDLSYIDAELESIWEFMAESG
jgi:hypothetical protein